MGMGLGWLRRARVRRTEKSCRGNGRAVLAGAALLALSGTSHSASAPTSAGIARPALWVVGDQDTIIYLFGTFHAHDGRARWFDSTVKTAFDGSDQLVLETLVPETPEAVTQALGNYRAQAANARPAEGGLASARTGMAAARSIGLSTEQGADAVLRRAADAAGKPVEGLESFEAQLRMYDRLPAPPSAASTSSAPNPAVVAFMARMLDSWNRGDPSTIEAVVNAVEVQSPGTYKTLFAERNRAWAGWIAERMQRPGVVFVAVGTGHLVGRDSVQARLAEHGIPTARLN